MEIIGQNGNDGEHYSDLDLNKDGKISKEEKIKAELKIKNLTALLNNKNYSVRDLNIITKELKKYQKLLLPNDITKTY